MKTSRKSSIWNLRAWHPVFVLFIGGLFFALTVGATIRVGLSWSVVGSIFAISAPLCLAFGIFTVVKGRIEGGVLAILTFAACIVGSMSLVEYFYITHGDIVLDVSVSEARNYPNGRIFDFSDAVLLCDYSGSYSTTSGSRERPGETTTPAYIVCPLVSEGWTPADPVPAWGRREHSWYQENPTGTFAAIAPHEWGEYVQAVKNTLEELDLHTFENAPILRWVGSIENYQEDLERARTFGGGTMLVLFAGWAFFAAISSARSYQQHRSHSVGKTASKPPVRTCPYCRVPVRQDRLEAHMKKCPKRNEPAVQSATKTPQNPAEQSEQPHSKPVIQTRRIPQGVVFVLPAPRDFYHPPGRRITLQRWKELSRVSLGVLAVFSVIGFFAIRAMWQPTVSYVQGSFGSGSIIEVAGVLGAISIPVAGWAAIMYAAFATLLSGIVSKEITIFHNEQLTTKTTFLGKTERKTNYEFSRIQHFQFLPEPSKGQAHLQFEYDGQAVACCRALDKTEAQVLYTWITDSMTYYCHAIEQIVFGHDDVLPEKEASYRILRNPEVLSLTTPFFHLEHLHIHTGSYDFSRLERFLTYAVNYIGADYLKAHVEAHLYGNSKKLHTNLRNNLMALCKEVHEYPE